MSEPLRARAVMAETARKFRKNAEKRVTFLSLYIDEGVRGSRADHT